MDFRILGPLEVEADGVTLDIGATKQRALLAVLLLEPGSAVPVERLIDALWEDDPPASAVNSVHVYVSQLRKLLGPRLATRGHGYALELQPGELDLHRFERLLDDGRERLGACDATAAARALHDGLALWRGPPLADFAYARFAQGEIRRLAELRLTAVQERIDADLERGLDRELVPELEALAAEHPLRERLREQLMLALYRSGRQADALAAYRTARDAMVEELGLEPSRELTALHGAILRQEPQLDRVRPARVRVLGRGRRGPLMVALGGVLLLSGIAAVALALTGGEPPAGLTTVEPNSVAVIDPGTDRIVADIPVGSTPSSITAGGSAVWVLNADDRTLSRIDPARLSVDKTIAAEREPTDLAAGAGAVWVGSGARAAESQVHGTFVPVGLARLDAGSGVVEARLRLPRPGSGPGALGRRWPGQHQLAVGGGSLWGIDAHGTISRFDARTNRLAGRTRDVSAGSLAADRDGLWVAADDNTVLRVDRRSTAVSQRVELPTFTLGGLAVGAGAVWVADPVAGTLWRIDPGPSTVTRTIAVGAGANAVAFGAGAVWVVNSLDGTVLRVDPATNRVVARIAVGGAPREIAVGHGRVWVTVAVGGDTGRQPSVSGAPRGGVAGALPPSICGQVSYGGSGSPRLLIASKLPLRSGPRGSTLPMAQAIEFVLARHRFQAGRHTVGYQSCDDSTDQAGAEDAAKCVGNAQALAAAHKVVGVIGPYGSGCAAQTIPILGGADGGPLALISASSSYPGLTRRVPGAHPGELEALYPTGVRNFARVYPTDDYQSAALAMLADRLHARRVFVLEDESGGDYTALLSGSFKRAAAALDLRIAGVASWDPEAAGYRSLVARVARARPRAVFLGGIVFDNAGPLVRELRRVLGPDVDLLAPDGFSVVPFLKKDAGAAANGMYISVDGAPNSALGPAGKRFVADFAATQPGGVVPSYTAAYAGQAAEILLAAIARSDGTRGSVARELFAAKVDDGILGTFAIDGNGDATVNPITILRVTGRSGRSPTLLADHAGTVLDRVLTPPAKLVAGG